MKNVIKTPHSLKQWVREGITINADGLTIRPSHKVMRRLYHLLNNADSWAVVNNR